jgi:hypothetical protein
VAHSSALKLHLFEQVADGLHALVPPEVGAWQQRNHRYGIKVWLGEGTTTPRIHLEAQVIGARYVSAASTLALEVGWHAEHPDPARNRAALESLLAAEDEWRRGLGEEAVAGPFIGHTGGWMRLSETWPDPDLDAPDLPFELSARLTDYLLALRNFL